MGILKAIAVALTLIAVATNPVVAMTMQCCCTQRAAPERTCCPCCQNAGEEAAQPRFACCLKKDKVQEGIRLGVGCCCVKAPPATAPAPAQEALAQHDVKGQPLALTTFASFDLAVLAPVSRYLDHVPGRFSLSGPPLLALYCTWLK